MFGSLHTQLTGHQNLSSGTLVTRLTYKKILTVLLQLYENVFLSHKMVT